MFERGILVIFVAKEGGGVEKQIFFQYDYLWLKWIFWISSNYGMAGFILYKQGQIAHRSGFKKLEKKMEIKMISFLFNRFYIL